MSDGNTNLKLDEAPLFKSNQVVSAEGKNYFYEETIVPISFYIDTQPENSNTINVVFVKRGRHVTMIVPRIENGTPGANGSIVAGPGSIPDRFRPATDNGPDVILDQFYHTCVTRQEGGTDAGNNLGRVIIWKDGRISIAKDVDGNPFLFTGASSFNAYSFSMQWLAQSAYNKTYVDRI